ncbi:TetR/AcrR family transcriptional regulator [bacterium]|nr:TetR/AcrR family transcriptional regulator [bacterium]
MYLTQENTKIRAKGKLNIFNASLELFVEKGIKATSVRDISKISGFTNPALYSHFKSKDDLSYHLYLSVFNVLKPDLVKILNPSQDSETIFRNIARDVLYNSFHQADFRNAYLYLYENVLTFYDRIKEEEKENPLDMWLEVIESKKEEGSIRSGSTMFQTLAIHGYMVPILRHHTMYADEMNLDDICLEFESYIKRSLLKD